MAVSPDDAISIVHAISIATVQLYREAELHLLRIIAAQLSKGIDAPAWAEQRLAAVHALRVSAGDVLGVLEQDLGPAVRQQIAEAYRTGYGAALTDLPGDAAVRLAAQQAAFRTVTRTAAMESLAVSIVADVGERHANVLRHVIDVYRATVAQATSLSLASGITRRQAAQQAFARFVNQGVTSFTDVSGRTWRLSSYVEMALRTVTQRAAVQGQTDRLQSLGLDLVIVSNSPGECPRCRPWEGKILAISGPTGRIQVESVTTGRMVYVDVAGTVDAARRAGLQHPNCTHALRAYLPGATQVPKGDLADPEHNKAKERQREIERAIRGWKEREAAALTPQAKRAAGVRIRAWQQEMRDHLAANPRLKRLRYREQPGAGNLPPKPQATPPTPPRPRPVPGPQPTPTTGPAPITPPTPAALHGDPLHGVDLPSVTDDELADHFSRISSTGTPDAAALNRVLSEMDRRAGAFEAPVEIDPRDTLVDQLIAKGYSDREAYAEAYDLDPAAMLRAERASVIDAQRALGETREQTVRRLYDEWVDLAYLRAEQATNGHMLNRQGQANQIRVRSLFSGTASRAAKYASPELAEWWSLNGGRLTYAEFRAEQLGRASDLREAAQARLGRRTDRDFGL